MPAMRKVIVICLSVFALNTQVLHARQNQSTAATMQEIFDAIAYLLPASANAIHDRDFADPGLVNEKLAALSASASTLQKHAPGPDKEFQLLARAFDRRIADVESAFNGEYPSFAWYSLMGLVEHCSACHARLPDDTDFVLGQQLLARLNVDELEQADLVTLLVATRQFESALGRLERELQDADIDPVQHDLGGTLVQYLNIAIAVHRDFDRARETLNNYLNRSDLPFYLRQRVQTWLADMQTYIFGQVPAADFDRARTLFENAGMRIQVPGDLNAVVVDLVAASMLRQALAAQLEPEQAAQAYYMLGVIALRTLELKPAVPEMELLLVAAIEAAPQGPYAQAAFALLEEYGFIEDERLSAATSKEPLIDLQKLQNLVVPSQ